MADNTEQSGDGPTPEDNIPQDVDLNILEELGIPPNAATNYFRQRQEETARGTFETRVARDVDETVGKATKEAQEREELLETGRKLYNEMLEDPARRHYAVYVGGTNYRIEHNVRHRAPQTLIEQHEKFKRKYPPQDTKDEQSNQRWDRAIPVIIEGFGREAMTHMSPEQPDHWKSLVAAFDLITEGGIRKNEEAMAALKSLAQNNIKLALEIQKAIREKEKTKAEAIS